MNDNLPHDILTDQETAIQFSLLYMAIEDVSMAKIKPYTYS